MSGNFLHLVSFTIPHPADYGGVIDVFYKIKSLQEKGVKVILHCFQYGRQPSKELEDLCFRVHYYPRKAGWWFHLHPDPYIVVTRNAKSMPERLLEDSFPVLFEGIHTTRLLGVCKKASKKVLVRAHNIEHRYYRALARSEKNPWKKLFLYTESVKLKRYEPILKEADYILGIAKHETAYFKRYTESLFIPPFHRFNEVSCLEGKGDYILFHGNLSVPDNSASFLSLLKTVLNGCSHRIIVAGKGPPARFKKVLSRHKGIELISDPGDLELEGLIRNAQINLLYSGQATGTKLKLIHSLFIGRHCLANREAVEGSGLEHLCMVAEGTEQLQELIETLMRKPFSSEQLRIRKKALQDYTCRAGAEKIVRLIG